MARDAARTPTSSTAVRWVKNGRRRRLARQPSSSRRRARRTVRTTRTPPIGQAECSSRTMYRSGGGTPNRLPASATMGGRRRRPPIPRGATPPRTRPEVLTMPALRTLFDKVWDRHVVAEPPGLPAVLYVDLHLIHEVTSPQAFAGLAARGLKVRRPDLTLATADHSVPTSDRSLPILDDLARAQVERLERNCAEHGIPLHGMHSPHQGIVHVIGPELGATQPGMTIVCGDSHTSTHGAFGALAFGIGTSEAEHVLATQTLLQRRPRTFEVRVEGRLAAGVTAKDVILALLAEIGVGAGTGHVFEYY